ncbi:MAG: alanine racemase [Oscillospiraceae bacterium]|nr:alanine racemase [Oscillospiraceae bacterium]
MISYHELKYKAPIRALVDLFALRHNLSELKKILPERTKIMAAVKADAYGHGSQRVSLELEKAGVDFFAVFNINEAAQLRSAGIKGDILVFGTTGGQAVYLAQNNITQTVFNQSIAKDLQQECEDSGIHLNIHIKADTGMGRLGFAYSGNSKQVDEIAGIYKYKNLNVTGIYSHLSGADGTDERTQAYTKLQYERFFSLITELQNRGFDTGITHIQNSAGIIGTPFACENQPEFSIARPGIALYGINPCKNSKVNLKPVMKLKSEIAMIKTVKKGEYISYGQTFAAPGQMEIATVFAGYADGYPRALSNKGRVLIGGKYAKIVGVVCMDQIMVDVTGIGADEGQEVTLFGHNGDAFLGVDELAETAGTISYEILSKIGMRVEREYLN